jgi:hypothetical protein
MQSKYTLILREPQGGPSWTSKVFNTVITLDTYQFLKLDDPKLSQIDPDPLVPLRRPKRSIFLGQEPVQGP